MAQDNPYPSAYANNPEYGFKRFPWAMHTAWGYPFNLLQNVIETTGAYTHHKKKISNAAAAAVLASTAGSTSAQVITAGITQPDVPRVLAVTVGGSGESAGTITITGYNVEGKLISDNIAYTTTGQVTGSLVFRLVSSITLPGALGASATVTVDTTNKIGLNHRGRPNYTTVIAIYDSGQSPEYSPYPTSQRPTLDAAVTASNIDGEFVEKNWVQTAHAPDGTTFFYFFYWFYNVVVYPPKDSPQFNSTTTSTSTSSTSSSTSISSTSTSISTTTSVSTSTSTSISSTSTSTTTLPV
jgi:hypothetical protein